MFFFISRVPFLPKRSIFGWLLMMTHGLTPHVWGTISLDMYLMLGSSRALAFIDDAWWCMAWWWSPTTSSYLWHPLLTGFEAWWHHSPTRVASSTYFHALHIWRNEMILFGAWWAFGTPSALLEDEEEDPFKTNWLAILAFYLTHVGK